MSIMLRRYSHLFLFLTVFSLIAPSVFTFGSDLYKSAESNKTDTVLFRIKQASENINTLEGDFIQKKKIEIIEEMPDSQGRFYYQNPDRLRWEILEPVKMGFVINGEAGRKWRGDSDRSRRFDVGKDPVISVISGQVFAWAKGDYEKLKAGYDISVANEFPVEIKLVPLSDLEKKYIDSIVLTFSENDNHVNSIEIIEKRGGATQIIFSNMIVNAELQEDIF